MIQTTAVDWGNDPYTWHLINNNLLVQKILFPRLIDDKLIFGVYDVCSIKSKSIRPIPTPFISYDEKTHTKIDVPRICP